MSRPPAYAKPLIQARRRGLVPARSAFGHVGVVLEWQEKRCGGLPRLVIPPDLEIEDVDLSCLAALDVLVAFRGSDSARIPDLLEAMFAAGAASVMTVNLDLHQEAMEAYSSGHAERAGDLVDRAMVWQERSTWQPS